MTREVIDPLQSRAHARSHFKPPQGVRHDCDCPSRRTGAVPPRCCARPCGSIALSVAALGLLLALPAALLEPLLGLDAVFLRTVGVLLLPFAAFVGWVASRETPPRGAVLWIVGLNELERRGEFQRSCSSAGCSRRRSAPYSSRAGARRCSHVRRRVRRPASPRRPAPAESGLSRPSPARWRGRAWPSRRRRVAVRRRAPVRSTARPRSRSRSAPPGLAARSSTPEPPAPASRRSRAATASSAASDASPRSFRVGLDAGAARALVRSASLRYLPVRNPRARPKNGITPSPLLAAQRLECGFVARALDQVVVRLQALVARPAEPRASSPAPRPAAAR